MQCIYTIHGILWTLENLRHLGAYQVKAGYADIPRDVLKGITLCFEFGSLKSLRHANLWQMSFQISRWWCNLWFLFMEGWFLSFRFFFTEKNGKIANLKNRNPGSLLATVFCGTPIGFCQETMPRPRSRVGIVGTTGCGKCGSPGWDYPEKVAEKGTSFRAKQIRRLGEISSFWPRIMVEQSSNS